jgi:hypothetical protein
MRWLCLLPGIGIVVVVVVASRSYSFLRAYSCWVVCAPFPHWGGVGGVCGGFLRQGNGGKCLDLDRKSFLFTLILYKKNQKEKAGRIHSSSLWCSCVVYCCVLESTQQDGFSDIGTAVIIHLLPYMHSLCYCNAVKALASVTFPRNLVV